MSDESSAKLTTASREHFGLLALDPDMEGFMASAENLADTIRRNRPAAADLGQWSTAVSTAAAAFMVVSKQAYNASEEQMSGIRTTLMMLGAVGYLLGDGQ